MQKTDESADALKRLDYGRHVISIIAKECNCKIDYVGEIHLPVVTSIKNFKENKQRKEPKHSIWRNPIFLNTSEPK